MAPYKCVINIIIIIIITIIFIIIIVSLCEVNLQSLELAINIKKSVRYMCVCVCVCVCICTVLNVHRRQQHRSKQHVDMANRHSRTVFIADGDVPEYIVDGTTDDDTNGRDDEQSGNDFHWPS